MRILLISGHMRQDDSVYLQLDAELRRLGHATTLYTEEDYLPERLPIPVRKLLVAWVMRRRLFAAATQVDVVDTVAPRSWALFGALRAAHLLKRPLLVTRFHGLEFKDEQASITEEIARTIRLPLKYKLITRRWLNWQEFRGVRQADVVACHASRELDAIVLAGLASEERVSVIPLGVEPRFFINRDYRGAGGRLLWFASWIERKGISVLPRALELAVRRLPDLMLTIGGTGLSADTVLSAFPDGLRKRITVLPWVSREAQIEIVREHDIFLFPSLSEGFGLALLEAMGSGLPCVTTFTGLAHDWLEHGQNCWLVPMSSPTALARAIERLHDDPELRWRIGQGAQKTARELTWNRFGERTAAMYAECLSALRGGVDGTSGDGAPVRTSAAQGTAASFF